MITCRDINIYCEVADIINTLVSEGMLNTSTSPKSSYIMVCCPFHHEKHPSSSITVEDIPKGDKIVPKGSFHCFGCGQIADVFSLVSQCLGKNDMGMAGIKWVQAHWKTEDKEGTHVKINSTFKKSNNTSRLRSRRNQLPAYTISEDILDSYRYYHPYMTERGLQDDYINFFDIGYDSELGTLTFPVKDLQGNVGYISRRSVGAKFHLQEKHGVKTDFIWGAYECIKELEVNPHQEVYICESVLNAIRYWQIGKLAVALLGTGGGNQYKLLSQIPAKYLVCSLDSDAAGRSGTNKILSNIYLKDKNIKSINYPEWVEEEGKDINNLADEEILNLTYEWYLGELSVGGNYNQSSHFE